MAAQLICNQWVAGSTPVTSSRQGPTARRLRGLSALGENETFSQTAGPIAPPVKIEYNRDARKQTDARQKKGGFPVATKSITKNVVLRSKPLARNFIRAVENAEGKASKTVAVSKTVHELKGQTLKDIFGTKEAEK